MSKLEQLVQIRCGDNALNYFRDDSTFRFRPRALSDVAADALDAYRRAVLEDRPGTDVHCSPATVFVKDIQLEIGLRHSGEIVFNSLAQVSRVLRLDYLSHVHLQGFRSRITTELLTCSVD